MSIVRLFTKIAFLVLFISPSIIAQETDFTFSDRIVIYDSLGQADSEESYFLSDANNDGLKDLIVRKDNGVLYVLENLGNGNFSNPDSLTTVEPNTKKIMLFDVDQDGYKDILFTVESEDGYHAYYRKYENGVFKRSVEITSSDIFRRNIYFNDIDNDGRIDILSYYEDNMRNEKLTLIQSIKDFEFSSEELIIEVFPNP